MRCKSKLIIKTGVLVDSVQTGNVVRLFYGIDRYFMYNSMMSGQKRTQGYNISKGNQYLAIGDFSSYTKSGLIIGYL